MTVLGLILARGGSKRIPGKNLRPLCGHSLIEWTLHRAVAAQTLDILALSSDDHKILREARGHPVIQIKRPAELATDECSSYPPIMHALDYIHYPIEWVVLLQPTSPLRAPFDIDECVMMAEDGELPAVASFEEDKDVPNGAVYVGRADWLRDGGSFDGPAVGRYFMPPCRSIDIDTEKDWLEAEVIIERDFLKSRSTGYCFE